MNGFQPERTFLFQFGSNMDETRLRMQIDRHLARFAPLGTSPDLTLLGPARLCGYRFTLDLFSATGAHLAADVVEEALGEVWGGLYSLARELVCRTDGQRSVLDRIEGHRTSRNPENYEPRQITVEFGEERVEAWTYIGCKEARARCARDHANARVSASYAASILAGATALAVPTGYVETLRALLDEAAE